MRGSRTSRARDREGREWRSSRLVAPASEYRVRPFPRAGRAPVTTWFAENRSSHDKFIPIARPQAGSGTARLTNLCLPEWTAGSQFTRDFAGSREVRELPRIPFPPPLYFPWLDRRGRGGSARPSVWDPTQSHVQEL